MNLCPLQKVILYNVSGLLAVYWPVQVHADFVQLVAK